MRIPLRNGKEAQDWLDQADPPPSWEQIAHLLKENRELQAKLAEVGRIAIMGRTESVA